MNKLFAVVALLLSFNLFSQYVVSQEDLALLDKDNESMDSLADEKLANYLEVLDNSPQFSIELSTTMLCYPQQTIGYAWCDITRIPGNNVFLKVYNVDGELLFNKRFNADVLHFDLDDYPPGYYIMVVEKEGQFGYGVVQKGFQ